MKKFLHSPIRTFLTGLLAVLPLILTIVVVIWVGNLIHRLAGPESAIGSFLVGIGVTVTSSRTIAYLMGFVFTALGIYLLGLLIQHGLQQRFQEIFNRGIRKIPLVGNVYDITHRFVGLLDQKDEADLKSMTPVWCFFGGEGGTAVLALLPAPEPIVLEGHIYHAILVPSAPVPVGGGLLYVPVDWIKPASFGVEGLTSIYVSMGVASSSYLKVPETKS